MATEVWISLDDDPDRSDLGAQWLLAGRLDESRETDVWRVVQGYLGYRASSRARSVCFYADVEPDGDGHRALLEARPPDVERLAGSGISFWVALRWAGPAREGLLRGAPGRACTPGTPLTRATSWAADEAHPGRGQADRSYRWRVLRRCSDGRQLTCVRSSVASQLTPPEANHVSGRSRTRSETTRAARRSLSSTHAVYTRSVVAPPPP